MYVFYLGLNNIFFEEGPNNSFDLSTSYVLIAGNFFLHIRYTSNLIFIGRTMSMMNFLPLIQRYPGFLLIEKEKEDAKVEKEAKKAAGGNQPKFFTDRVAVISDV